MSTVTSTGARFVLGLALELLFLALVWLARRPWAMDPGGNARRPAEGDHFIDVDPITKRRRVAADKVQHFTLGIALGAACLLWMRQAGAPTATALAQLLVLLGTIGWEMVEKYPRRGFPVALARYAGQRVGYASWKDVVVGNAGGALGACVLLLLGVAR